VKGFSSTYFVVVIMNCHAHHDVSQLIVGICPFLVLHYLCTIEIILDFSLIHVLF
jgi:hypothetical protein